jgi:hypothetical protein
MSAASGGGSIVEIWVDRVRLYAVADALGPFFLLHPDMTDSDPRPTSAAIATLCAHPRFHAAMRADAASMVALYRGNRILNALMSDRARALFTHLALYLHYSRSLDGVPGVHRWGHEGSVRRTWPVQPRALRGDTGTDARGRFLRGRIERRQAPPPAGADRKAARAASPALGRAFRRDGSRPAASRELSGGARGILHSSRTSWSRSAKASLAVCACWSTRSSLKC